MHAAWHNPEAIGLVEFDWVALHLLPSPRGIKLRDCKGLSSRGGERPDSIPVILGTEYLTGHIYRIPYFVLLEA